MNEPLYNIFVTDIERRIIIKALSTLKEKQIQEGKNFDMLDELIVRSCDAPIRKKVRYETR